MLKLNPFASLLASTLAILFHLAPAQGQVIEWQKCLGGGFSEDGYSIAGTQDGGFVLAGETNSSNGDVSGMNGYHDFWVVKVSSTGVMEWQKCLGGDGWESARSVQQTSDGGYIVAGFAQSNNGDVSGNHGGTYDAWVVKLSSTGSLEWQKCLGGSAEDKAHCIVQTSDGGYVMTGFTKSSDGDVSNNNGWTDLWVVKLSSSGSIQWEKTFGGSEGEEGWSVIQTPDGGYAVTGKVESTDNIVVGNHGNTDAWVLKLSSTGSLEWQKCVGGSSTDSPFRIIQSQEGGYLVAGETQSQDGDVSGNHGAYDAWIFKMNAAGNLEWQKCYGGNNYDNFRDVKQGADGNYTMTGFSYSNNGDVSGNHGSSDFWTVNVNSTGQLNWQICNGGSQNEEARGIWLPGDGSVMISGYVNSVNADVTGNHGEADFWLVRLAPVTAVEKEIAGMDDVLLFQDPASEVLTVSIQGDAVFSASVYDTEGRKLTEKTGISRQAAFSIQGFPKGFYLLKINQNEHTIYRRFIH